MKIQTARLLKPGTTVTLGDSGQNATFVGLSTSLGRTVLEVSYIDPEDGVHRQHTLKPYYVNVSDQTQYLDRALTPAQQRILDDARSGKRHTYDGSVIPAVHTLEEAGLVRVEYSTYDSARADSAFASRRRQEIHVYPMSVS